VALPCRRGATHAHKIDLERRRPRKKAPLDDKRGDDFPWRFAIAA
jgi:hypothetical protein